MRSSKVWGTWMMWTLAVGTTLAGLGCARGEGEGEGESEPEVAQVGSPSAGAAGSPADLPAAPASANAELVSDSNQYAGKHPPPLVSQLDSATAGLLFMSESDYPLEVLYWTRAGKPKGPPSVDELAALTGHLGELVEEQSLDTFFRGATTPQEGQSTAELETVQRYQDLVRLLRKKLSFIRVFRFGRIQIHSFVVGVTSSGAWAGLSTIQIET